MRDPHYFWPDGTPRSSGNAFDWRAWTGALDLSRESAAARAGANAAATKRARGQELMPRLALKGSQRRHASDFEESCP